ncbi:MAG: hypothetical protein IPP32_00010 [Bacteroidetes bacterium]|nr:hypothetical protein [Bacteroidota bacterium]
MKSNAITDSLISVVNGKFYDVFPRNSDPFEQGIIFSAAPLKEKLLEGNVKFYLSRDFFISNQPDPAQIEIDFDDGVGYRIVNFGNEILINYSNNNTKNIRVKLINSNGTNLKASATSSIEYCIGAYDALTNPNGYPPIDENIAVSSMIPYFGANYEYPVSLPFCHFHKFLMLQALALQMFI